MQAAVAVIRSGRSIFTRKDVRDEIGVSSHVWLYSYTAIFQAMRMDHPGGAPEINARFKNVFKRVERGKFMLTPYGMRLAEELGLKYQIKPTEK